MEIIILFLFLGLVLWLMFLSIMYLTTVIPGILYAPYVPISKEVIKLAFEDIDITDDMVVYDLGCGDARVLSYLSQKGVKNCIGIEMAFWPYIKAKFLQRKNQNITLIKGNFYKKNIQDANLVFCYLFPKVMAGLENKFEKELKPGTIIVSCAFSLPNWQPERVVQTKKMGGPIYIYRVQKN